MAMIRKTITIPDAMDRWVKAQIEQGRYGNDSEYFRDLIRRDQDQQAKLAALRTAIQEGRSSGESKDGVSEILAKREPGLAKGKLTDAFFDPLPTEEFDSEGQ